jgi:hypothetical protein
LEQNADKWPSPTTGWRWTSSGICCPPKKHVCEGTNCYLFFLTSKLWFHTYILPHFQILCVHP